LGLLVWQDMPSGNNDTAGARAQFEREVAANLAQLHNHPSIVVWGLFNEGWGAYDEARLTQWMKAMDPSRLLNAHSGPYDQLAISQAMKRRAPSQLPGPFAGTTDIREEFQAIQLDAQWPGGDMVDVHYYPGPRMPQMKIENVAAVTGEHGSFGVFIPGHVADELKPLGKGLGATRASPAQLHSLYEDSIEQLKLLEKQGLAASHYFQLYDVETEQQGFFTYDREIAKVPVAEIARLNSKLVQQATNYAAATQSFVVAEVDTASELEGARRLAATIASGQSTPARLRRLALIALRQSDHATAAEAASTFIARSSEPYSIECWRLIAAMTRTLQDPGFELLRTRASEANAALGSHVVQHTLLNVIRREFLDPYLNDPQGTPDWEGIEAEGVMRYGELAREAVQGARMMHELVRSDWRTFARSYVNYYATALGHSAYADHALAYRVLENVDDVATLEVALRVMEHLIEQQHEFKFGPYDPAELDTYAGLLHKVGRVSEALRWQQKAVAVCEGRDPQIVENFRLMRMRRKAVS
jgi:hypothetical protein